MLAQILDQQTAATFVFQLGFGITPGLNTLISYTSPFDSEFDVYEAVGFYNSHTEGAIFAMQDNSGRTAQVVFKAKKNRICLQINYYCIRALLFWRVLSYKFRWPGLHNNLWQLPRSEHMGHGEKWILQVLQSDGVFWCIHFCIRRFFVFCFWSIPILQNLWSAERNFSWMLWPINFAPVEWTLTSFLSVAGGPKEYELILGYNGDPNVLAVHRTGNTLRKYTVPGRSLLRKDRRLAGRLADLFALFQDFPFMKMMIFIQPGCWTVVKAGSFGCHGWTEFSDLEGDITWTKAVSVISRLINSSVAVRTTVVPRIKTSATMKELTQRQWLRLPRRFDCQWSISGHKKWQSVWTFLSVLMLAYDPVSFPVNALSLSTGNKQFGTWVIEMDSGKIWNFCVEIFRWKNSQSRW